MKEKKNTLMYKIMMFVPFSKRKRMDCWDLEASFKYLEVEGNLNKESLLEQRIAES